MTTKGPEHAGFLDVSSWLAELHMECYKKNLEDYESIKPLLELRESDIKKLGVVNSKDRSRMMTSLASYKSVLQPTAIAPAGPVAQVQESHKSLLRKSSLKKLNIKSFLSSGSSKKNKGSKKAADPIHTEVSQPASAEPTEDITTSMASNPHTTFPPPLSMADKPVSSSLADYEEVPDMLSPLVRSMTIDTTTTKPFQVSRQSVVENEYVPSPENSPNFSSRRQRASTISNPTQDTFQYLHRGGVVPPHLQPSHNSTPELLRHQPEASSGYQQEEDSPSHLTHKHLSMVSMESGLSFGYDVEKDFNPSQPLEAQPWFHGKIQRADAESLLHDDGDFLVRENTTMSNTFTLTLRWRGVADHTLIGTTEVISTTSLLRGSTVKYQFDSGAFDSIPELIYNHLKYQIPIDKAQHTLITNPVCRPGNQGKGGLNLGVYTPPTTHQRSNFSPESSPSSYSSGGPVRRRSGSPLETARFHSLRKPASTDTPPDRLSKHLSASSGDLLEASKEEVHVSLRNVISPPPDSRGRSMSMLHAGGMRHSVSTGGQTGLGHPPPAGHRHPGNHQRVDSFGDYEVMESVSILKESPSLARKNPQPQATTDSRDYARTQSVSAGSLLSRPHTARERVQYAEIRYPKEGGPGVIIKSGGSNNVNYAEVRFASRSNTVSTPARQPHPFAVYDTVPRREATPPHKQETTPYQSRADVMAQRLQADPTYSTPNPSTSSKRPASARPLTNYATIQFPLRQNNDHAHSHTPSPQQSSSQHVPITQTDTTLYSLPSKSRHARTRELSASNDSLLSSTSGHSSTHSPKHGNSPKLGQSPKLGRSPKHVMGARLIQSHTPSLKVHKTVPGYEALVKVHTILQNNSNDELAYHMTRTDAVSFLLAPRPGEDRDIWKERVKHVTSSSGSGVFCGLQTLADPDGEKLWKKLYFRHLNLSQTITLTVITAGDALERAKLLHRYVDVAQLLQSEKYGNLFSFIAIMQGLAAPQLSGMTEVWDLLKTHYPDELAMYRSLQSTVTAIDQGQTVLSPDSLTIPPIQHLKPIFHFTEHNLAGYPHTHQDHSIVGEFLNIAMAMEALRTIIAGTVNFTVNAWRNLESLKYNVNLMEFLTQDFTRMYLQAISVQNDDPLERRRRLGLLMEALVDRIESEESV